MSISWYLFFISFSVDKMHLLPQHQIKLQSTTIKPQLSTSKLPPQTPNYRSVKGYKQCLGRNKKRNQLFPTDCLYRTQPRNCKNTTWKKLYEIIGKGGLELCEPKGILVNHDALEYLLIAISNKLNIVILSRYIHFSS